MHLKLHHFSHIRPMRAEDIPAVLAIEKQVSLVPWTKEVLTHHLPQYTIVDTIGKVVLGYAVMSVHPGYSHIKLIGVLPEEQGQGIGTDLLRACIQRSVDSGNTKIELEVSTENLVAIALYKKHGFKVQDILANYYSAGKGNRHAYLMVKE